MERKTETEVNAQRPLARFILQWLRERNAGELNEVIGDMRVRDLEIAESELASILAHGGKPPNWV